MAKLTLHQLLALAALPLAVAFVGVGASYLTLLVVSPAAVPAHCVPSIGAGPLRNNGPERACSPGARVHYELVPAHGETEAWLIMVCVCAQQDAAAPRDAGQDASSDGGT